MGTAISGRNRGKALVVVEPSEDLRYLPHMTELTAAEATMLVGLATLIGGGVGWVGRGLSFVLIRWWTGVPKKEGADYLNSVADLAVKLRQHGMSMGEVRELEAAMRRPSAVASPVMGQVIEQIASTTEPQEYLSNFAMKSRTNATYMVAEARLQQALLDLSLLIGEKQRDALTVTQKHWEDYRASLSDFAELEFEGGTHAPLAAAWAGLSETERRTEEVLAEIAERTDRRR